MDRISRNTYIIAALAFIVIVLGVYFLFIFKKGEGKLRSEGVGEEVRSASEIAPDKRPYVTLTPTSDGAEIIISIENMGEFEKIEYEMTYLADNPTVTGEKIQRGSTGSDVNTKEPKYKKNILLGTASRGVRSPDRGVEEGELVLHMYRGEIEYLSETPWDLVEAGSKAGKISDRGGKLSLTLPNLKNDSWFIIADTVGVPVENRSFDVSSVALPVWGVFSVAGDFKNKAELSIKFEQDVGEPTLYSYIHEDSSWLETDSKYSADNKLLTAEVDSVATFVVVSPTSK